MLGHMMGSLNPQLEQKVDQVKVLTSMVVPIPITLHAKSNSSWWGIGTGVLASRIPGPVIRGKGLTGNDAVLKGATSEVGIVLERHDGGDDDEDSSWTTNFFYLPRSCTIPKVVWSFLISLIGWLLDGPTSFVFVYFPLFGFICHPSVYIPRPPLMYSLVLFSQEILPSTISVWLRLSGVLLVFTLLRGNLCSVKGHLALSSHSHPGVPPCNQWFLC